MRNNFRYAFATYNTKFFLADSDEFLTYERGGVVGTEAGVDGPGFPVLAQKLCVVRRVGFYQQTCQKKIHSKPTNLDRTKRLLD